jgi:thiamine-monophosphate kinase
MNEQLLIEEIAKLTAVPRSRWLSVGIGDDCAVLKPLRAGEETVITTDLSLQDRHFRLNTHRANEIGHKALARALSDLAAMGARPMTAFVSLAVTGKQTTSWIRSFYGGIKKLADEHEVEIGGGDLSRHKSVVIDVMLLGKVPQGSGMLRSAARAGDVIYVSGLLGGSALGLEMKRGPAWRIHKTPAPRVSIGQSLRKRGVRCAMDLSDGISLDLARLAEASGLSANLDHVPLFPGATESQALHGGEDYELLFTAPTSLRIPQTLGIPVGTMHRGPSGLVTLRRKPISPKGWDPFR